MFKIQTKTSGRWRDLHTARNFEGPKRFATEAAAWAYVERLDQDGYRDTGNYRVVVA